MLAAIMQENLWDTLHHTLQLAQPAGQLMPCISACPSTGAMYGTYEAFRYKVPGLYKVRYIGQVCTAAADRQPPVLTCRGVLQ
jgi:hypothetical protein